MSTKNYDAGFKAKVAIEALKGDKSNVELCAEYKIPNTNLYDWKDKLLKEAKNVFIPESEQNKQRKLLEEEVTKLHKVIGEITVENNYLKKKLWR